MVWTLHACPFYEMTSKDLRAEDGAPPVSGSGEACLQAVIGILGFTRFVHTGLWEV